MRIHTTYRFKPNTNSRYRNKAKISKILETISDGIYIINDKYELEYVNPVMKRIFGEANNKKCYEYIHKRIDVCPWCKSNEVFSGKTCRWEWYSDLHNRVYDITETPLTNDNENMVKLVIFRDITDSKVRKEVSKSEQDIFVKGKIVVFCLENIEGFPVEYVSPNIKDQLGYDPADFKTGSLLFTDIIHPDDLEKVIGKARQLSRTGAQYFEQDYRVGTKQGRYKWVNDFTMMHRNDKGEVTRFYVYLTDVSYSKKIEDTFWLTQYALDNVGHEVFCITTEGRFIYVNDTMCRKLGYTRKELLSLNILDIDPNYPKDVKQNRQPGITPQNSFIVESTHHAKTGETFPVELLINFMNYRGMEINFVCAYDMIGQKK